MRRIYEDEVPSDAKRVGPCMVHVPREGGGVEAMRVVPRRGGRPPAAHKPADMGWLPPAGELPPEGQMAPKDAVYEPRISYPKNLPKRQSEPAEGEEPST